MPLHQPTPSNPRQRLSLFTNSTLGHDVSAAFKASGASRASQDINETPAPPPSPVDFSFPSTPNEQRTGGDHMDQDLEHGLAWDIPTRRHTRDLCRSSLTFSSNSAFLSIGI
ncbi:hypothetical protein P154DRAFT_575875 [Amniculicola lignicola CBS 123094]|uniref:Uncharacterized protein n=1 Tax=Amniculicola lignicola CBS 123094 TaxID=1392246 RepID=A0A6A5WSJ5_9PLEO|nr:hypothetical protein P154DRAFT_575875 [Amniculicola lignicola CBS 123094]